MKIHVYDFLNKNKIALLDGSEFTAVKVDLTIDDFATASLSYNGKSRINEVATTGFENVYIEDDAGNIIFGGILASYSITETDATWTMYDHRWVLSRLILDSVIELGADDNVLDVVAELIDAAKAKRAIPLEFDLEGSAFNPDYHADLRFEVGDDIGTALQKIIQSTYSRWAVRYFKSGNEISGKLVVRSVRGVTPEGVGISRTIHQSEDGDRITMRYIEGDPTNNIQSFTITQDLSRFTTRFKLGAKVGEESLFFDSTQHLTDGYTQLLEFYFGRTDGYATDYKANSAETGRSLANIYNVLPRIETQIVVSPEFTRYLNAGDRVGLTLHSPMIQGIKDNTVRVDAITYQSRDGYFERTMLLNFMSPQVRPGTTGLLQKISDMEGQLDGLNKNYFNRG